MAVAALAQAWSVVRRVLAAFLATFVAFAGLALVAASPAAAAPPGFVSGSLVGASINKPTAMQFGPDGRLYALELDGDIKAFTVQRNGAGDYEVTGTETIDLVKNLPNHGDDGTPAPGVTGRLATGLVVTGTAANPVLYVGSSDPRIGGGNDGTDEDIDTNSGVISRLTWDGAAWQHLELVRGLPRSEENHAINGLELDLVTNTLYGAQGGNTNLGAPSFNFVNLPEYALSAAVLSFDLDAIGESTYDIPTLAGTALPFGGQGGDNQGKLVAGGPVQVHAPGFRNPYDVVLTEAGELYTVDNGSNSGWGDVVDNEGPAGNCTNAVQEPGFTEDDNMHNITVAGTYGGHANVVRGNPLGTPWAGAVPAPNPIECDYQPVAGAVDGNMTTFPVSTNSLDEYRASNFGGEMQGDIIAVGLNPPAVYRIELSADGRSVTANTTLFSGLSGRHLGLDVLDDDEVFPGTIWVGEFTNNGIVVFEPNDYDTPPPVCAGADDPTLDEDSDGFDNADEIDNGTDPCSAADVPPDNDGDFESDLNDPDDDNDTVLDGVDAFAVDPANGAATNLPIEFDYENSSPPAGGILDLGFTGLMTNGTDYLDLFDPFAMTIGGAAGVVTIDAAGAGTAQGAANTAEYGFQVGTAPQVNPYEAALLVGAPFAGASPTAGQQMGLFMGNGTQDDYLKLVITDTGLELGVELGGSYTSLATATETIPGPDAVDLFFQVDPTAGTVQASYQLYAGGTPGARTDIGTPQSVPAGWLTSPAAYGVISTAATGPTFPVTLDRFSIKPVSTGGDDVGATMSVTPTGGLNSSSSGAGSFSVTNTSLSADITSISLDTTSALLPDIVFDPDGTAGDTSGSDVTIDVDPGIGYLGRTFATPNNGLDGDDGWHVVTMDFGDFNPGETMAFSTDLDPTSIKGTARPGPDGAGKISGYELSGSVVTVGFSDGTTLSNELFPLPNTKGSGVTTVDATREAAPVIELLGTSGNPVSVTTAEQVVRISGPAGAAARLIRPETTLAISGSGYDIDAFETNKTVSVDEYTATIGGQGYVDIPIVLTDAAPEGINILAATLASADGEPGHVSNIVTVELDPFGGGNAPPTITPVASQSMLEGETLAVVVTATDPDGDPVALSASGVPSFGSFVDNGDNSGTFTFSPAAGDAGSYPGITVTAADGNGGTDNEAFTLGVAGDQVPPGNVLYRVNAGGVAVAANDGGPEWAIDTKNNPSPLHNEGSKAVSYDPAVTPDATVPVSTPAQVFETERKDPGPLPEMEWEFPAAAGETVEVRLFIASNAGNTTTPGSRKFDVWIDGNQVLDDYDPVADVGHQVGTMKSFQIVSDGIVDVDFGNVKNRPIVNAIEILGTPGLVAPSELVAQAASSSSVELTWTDNSVDETEFEIERSTDGSSFSPLGAAGADATSYTDQGLAIDTTYWYRIRAASTVGVSDWSNTASVTLGNAPPLITPIGSQSVVEGETLQFDVIASDANGDPVALSASGVPSFGSFVDNGDNSGTFTFSPAAGDAGSYPGITVTAADGNGGIDNEAFNLDVTEPGNVLYRVNAGGVAVAANDGGPEWAIDTKNNPSPLHNEGSKAVSYDPAVTVDGSVPASTPAQVFETERKDPNPQPEMEWDFPVAPGETIEVRLFIASNAGNTTNVGSRKFDVSIDGNLVLDDYDPVADVGHQVGTMKTFQIVSDGNIDVDFGNVKNRPIVNAIEILATG